MTSTDTIANGTKDTNPLLVSFGELLWDMLPEGKRAGGAPANLAYHAANNGVDAVAITAVGDDEDGRELTALLESHGVQALAQTNAYPTGTVEVTLRDGIPSYNIIENVAWDHIDATDEVLALAERADALCYGSTVCRQPGSRETLLAMLNAAPEQAIRFFDINLRPCAPDAGVLRRLLERSSILKINDEELEALSRMYALHIDADDEEHALALLQEAFDLDGVVLTAGASHSTVLLGGECSRLETPHVTVADTVGAGDAFSGAFVAALLQGKSLAQAHRLAVQVSAFACTQSGAWSDYTAFNAD